MKSNTSIKSVSSKKSSNAIITQQEMVLIKHSEEAKNTEIYGNLYFCLEPYKKLTYGDLDKDIVFDEKARVVLLNNKSILTDNINREWYSMKSWIEDEKDVFCQLCGRKNKYIFYIKNRLNGIELNVGSDCVGKFKDITGLKVEKSKLNRTSSDRKKESRRIEFEVAEGDDIGFFKNAQKSFDEFPILLPYKLYSDIKNVIVDANRLKTSYIKDGKYFSERFEKYCSLREEYNNLYDQALKHYDKVMNNPLVCKKDVANWLKDNFELTWESVQRNNGILNAEALRKVYYPNFLKEKIDIFRQHLKCRDIKLLTIEETVIRFSIKNELHIYPINFIVPIKDFMKIVGCHCLTNEFYTFDKPDIPNITIENTKENFQAIRNSIITPLKHRGYNLFIDNRTSEIYWEKNQSSNYISRWSRRTIYAKPIYKKTSLERLLQLMSKYILLDEESFNEKITEITYKIDSSGQWITKDEVDRNALIASEAAGLQKQKDFIPY